MFRSAIIYRALLPALVAVAATAGGCTSPGRAADTRGDPSTAGLERRAEREARLVRGPGKPVAVPPGVQDEILQAPAVAGPRQAMSLARALAEAAAFVPPRAVGPEPAPPADPAARDRALRHYVKGRDAQVQDRQVVAITELEKARALDPRSPEILRWLARSYLAMDNVVRAAGLYEQLLEVEPDDPEALFAVGVAASYRRNFDAAAAWLSRPRLRGESFRHDPAADLLADHHLAEALARLGYDRAAIELSRSLLGRLAEAPRGPGGDSSRALDALYQRQSDLWQSIGDAHCRLGAYREALEAYGRAAPLAADPETLRLRVVYANLCLGRTHTAQLEVLRALDGMKPVNGSAGDGALRLCAYLAAQVEDTSLLAEAVASRSRERADDAGLVRAAAVLLERDAAVALLRGFLERNPEDLGTFAQLSDWLAAHDPATAAALTVDLAAAHPALARRYADRLAIAAPSPRALVEALRALPESPARALVESRVLASIGGLGPAWDVVAAARAAWPQSQLLVGEQIELAGRLKDPQLLEAAIVFADRADPALWIEIARARRELGRTGPALEAAAEAQRLAPRDVGALVELAQARVDHAAAAEDPADRQGLLGEAVAAAESAIAIDPRADGAYAVIQRVYASGQLSREGRGEPGQGREWRRLQELRERLARDNPGSSLGRRLDARDDVIGRRYEAAIARVEELYGSDPSDVESLALGVAAWIQLGELDDAARWLEERLRGRPADAALLEAWVDVQTRRHRYAEIAGRLESVLESEPAHDVARMHLERVYAHLEQTDQALVQAERRLLSRPEGIRRELELAATWAGAGRSAEALVRLRWVLDRAATATHDQLLAALALAGRLGDAGQGDEALTVELVEVTVGRFPESPLQVYGTGLRGLARLGRIDDRFDALASRGAASARGANGPDLEAADAWRQLAQALVNAGHPAAAARALRARLLGGSALDGSAQVLLLAAAIAATAGADRPEDAIQTIRSLTDSGRLAPAAGAERAESIEEWLAGLFFEASTIYLNLGREAGACRLLQEAVGLDADHAMILNNLGYTRLGMGHGDEQTVEWIEQAYRQEPEDANVLDTTGWLRYKQGRLAGDGEGPGALWLIEQAISRAETDPQDDVSPEVLDHLGDTKWRLGDLAGARAAWRRVVDMLGAPERREQILRDLDRNQLRFWGLLVADPGDLYRLGEGAVLERARAKIQAAEQGAQPPVAATFAEVAGAGGPGAPGASDGRP